MNEDMMGVMSCITQARKGQNAKFIVCLSRVRACLFFSAVLRFQISFCNMPSHLAVTEKMF